MAVSREVHLVAPEHALLREKRPLASFVERELRVLDPALVKWEIRLEDIAPCWKRISIGAEGRTSEGMHDWVVALSNALSDYYLTSWEPLLVDRFIQECFEVENTQEMRLIRRYCAQELAESPTKLAKHQEEPVSYVARQEVSSYALRRWTILDPVTHHLQVHDQLNLQGFYHFRLQNYRDLLFNCVEHAVEEYIIDREYQEFILLLQSYVQSVPPKCALMHLCQEGDGTYRLYQENGRMVTEEQVAFLLREQVVDVEWGEVAYEDLIVTILMNFSPAQIVVHLRQPEYGQVFYTVKAIFQERVKVELDDKQVERISAKHFHEV